jgi:exopolysaccharide production protein ExoQ
MNTALALPDAARASRAGASAAWLAFCSLLLLVCVVEYSQAWIYPPAAAEAIAQASARLPLRITLWAMAPLAIAVYLVRRGFAGPLAALAPFVLFWLSGLVAAFLGFDPIVSLRLVGPWLLMALAACVIGFELPAQRVFRIVLSAMVAMLLGSIALALLLPERGTMIAAGLPVWRGLFIGKNWLGQIAAWCLVAAVCLATAVPRRLAWSTAALALVCLIGSASKGALVGAGLALAIAALIAWLSRRLAPALVVLVLAASIACTVVVAMLALPLLLEALHRDITLTGRTLIWSVYLRDMVQHVWFGQGPGAYTNPSVITLPLAQKLAAYGPIFTPHNAFLGVFGDAGIFGAIGFVVALVWTVLAPLWQPSLAMRASSALCLTIAVTGLVETVQVFGASAGLFLVILLRAVALAQRR